VYLFILNSLTYGMPKIAIIQMRASTDKSKNLKKILDYIGKAAKQGASLCTFPEFMMFYTKASQTPEQLANMAESIHGNFVTKIAEQLNKTQLWLSEHFMKKVQKKIVCTILAF